MARRNVVAPLFLLLLVFLVFLIRRWNEPERKEAFDRNPPTLKYTHQALCQMNCRQISKEEIGDIIKKGIIHFNRSNRRSRPCPTFALQGRTVSQRSLLVFFSQCPEETVMLTCYTPREEITCNCPKDENKGGR